MTETQTQGAESGETDRRSLSFSRNTAWGVVSEGFRLGVALLVFLILTNTYEVELYGALVGTVALMGFLVPIASFGAGYLLLQRIAGQNWPAVTAFARALGAVLLGGILAAVVLVTVQPWLLPQVPVEAVALLAVTELLLAGMIEVAVMVAMAIENLRLMTIIRVVYGLARLGGAVLLFAFVAEPELWHWAALAMVAGVGAAAVSHLLLFGRMVVPSRVTALDIKEGIPFSLGFGADKLRESADAFMLVRFDQGAEAGLYGAGHRIVSAAVSPLRSLMHASNARFFSVGSESAREGARMARRLSSLGLLYSVPLGLLLWVASDALSSVLPGSYAEAADVIRWMSVLPVLRSLEIFPASALTGAGHHLARVRMMMASAVLNIGINFALIPQYGWEGAVVATILSNVAYIIGLWITLGHVARRFVVEPVGDTP